jgi:hypothetical protein
MAGQYPREVTSWGNATRWQNADGATYATREEAVAIMPPTPIPPEAPGAQDTLMDPKEWWMGIGFSVIAIGFLSGPILLAHHTWIWLKTGLWENVSVADGMSWFGFRPLHTEWVGLQHVFDWLMGSPLWAALPIATGLLTWIVFAIAEDAARNKSKPALKPNPMPRRATSPNPVNVTTPAPAPIVLSPPVAKVSWSKVIKRIFGGWFWPRLRREETSAAIRAGRVIHWTFLVFAAPPAIVAGFAIFVIGDRDMFGIFVVAFLIALGLALIGRGLRYVLADE